MPVGFLAIRVGAAISTSFSAVAGSVRLRSHPTSFSVVVARSVLLVGISVVRVACQGLGSSNFDNFVAVIEQRLVGLAADPKVMQKHGEFARDGDRGSFLGVLATSARDRFSVAT